jgi:hypothetical protein
MSETKFKLVIVESPFAGDIEKNQAYARACMNDCLLKGEAPYASHLLYTQQGVLNDLIPEERKLGIEAGLAWGKMANASVVYTDLGISGGMEQGIKRAKEEGREVIYRELPGFELWNEQYDEIVSQLGSVYENPSHAFGSRKIK